jgi:hypothetical protein
VIKLRKVDADREAQEAIDSPHPVGVALGEVVVDRDDVNTLAGQRIEIRRKCGDQRLALARSHLGDLAVVERDTAQQLNIEVPHRERALAGLTNHGERLRQDCVELLAFRDPPELAVLAAAPVRQRRRRRLERIDFADCHRVLLEEALVAAPEDAGEDVGDHVGWT